MCSIDDIVYYENRLIPEKASYNLSESVSLRCMEGYANIGSTVQVCLEDGSWSTAKPLCVGKQQRKFDLLNTALWKRF